MASRSTPATVGARAASAPPGPPSVSRLADAPRLAATHVRDHVAGLRGRLAAARPARGARPAPELRPGGEPARTDWRRIGAFGVGVAVGALLGAGSALLLAPATGFETRVRLARRARHVGDRVVDRFDDLGNVVRRGAKRTRSQVGRSLVRGRWAAEDAWERRWLEAKRRARAEG